MPTQGILCTIWQILPIENLWQSSTFCWDSSSLKVTSKAKSQLHSYKPQKTLPCSEWCKTASVRRSRKKLAILLSWRTFNTGCRVWKKWLFTCRYLDFPTNSLHSQQSTLICWSKVQMKDSMLTLFCTVLTRLSQNMRITTMKFPIEQCTIDF